MVDGLSGDNSPAVVPEGIKLLRFGGHYAFAGNHIIIVRISQLLIDDHGIRCIGMVHPATRLDNITGEEVIRRCITIRYVGFIMLIICLPSLIMLVYL